MLVSYCVRNPQDEREYQVVALHLVHLAPGTHDEGIVRGNDGHHVDALLLQLGQVLDVAGDMVDGAGGGEGA